MQGRNKPGFPYWAQDTIWSSPVWTYVNGDHWPEIFVGIDCGWGGSTCYKKFGHVGGAVIALRHDGSVAPGFPISMPGQVVWSTPAVAPLLGNGGNQVIYGSGLFYPNAGRTVQIYDTHGHAIASIPMYGRTFSSPAIGEILPTGKNQIVIGSEDGYTDIIDTNWHRLAHICTAPTTKGCTVSHSSPIIGDLNNDGFQEVIAVGSNTWHVIDHTLKSVLDVQIKETAFGLAASPTLANVDGKATLFFTLIGAGAGGNHAEVVSYVFPQAAGWSAWPMFKADPNRDGNPLPGAPVPAH